MSAELPIRRVLFTGHRDYADLGLIERTVELMIRKAHGKERLVIVHGGAKDGADHVVDNVAKRMLARGHDLVIEEHPYPEGSGKAGGPIRNSKMVKLNAAQCVAFWDGRLTGGTVDTMAKAARARIPIWVPA